MKMKKHTKKFGVYHWDTFDNETFLKHQADTIQECKVWIVEHYGDRLHERGADRVEIVDDKGDIREKYNVG
jgi:hypothetical protein